MLKIHDYKCKKCGAREERYVRNEENQLCYKCGNKMEKLNTFQGMIAGNFADKVRTK